MPDDAVFLAPAQRRYSGEVTVPERWATWRPRRGDVLVCTPPKCGTTWTQTILAMLLSGSTDLPGKLPFLSPWVDADLGIKADQVAEDLAAQRGRRVVKTHTPADGFALWDGVSVIAVYRHPLDVFLSLRKHVANRKSAADDNPMRLPLDESLAAFIESEANPDDFDRDCLANIVLHYRETVMAARVPGLGLFHYDDMLRAPRDAVRDLAEAVGAEAGDALLDDVAEATAFDAMKARAGDFAPAGGTGYWHSDAAFFDAGRSAKWADALSPDQIARFESRLAVLLPEADHRAWLLGGGARPHCGHV